MSQSPAPNYPALGYSQQWQPLTTSSRHPSHSLLHDQGPSRYETSTGPYGTNSSSSVPGVAAEGSSIFPGLSPLVNNLPAHGGNRTLPHPMTIHSSFDGGNNTSTQGSDGDAGLYQQRLGTGTSQGSANPVSQDAISTTGQASSVSSSPSETQEMPSFGYIPMSQTSPSASSENTSGFRSIDTSATSNVGSYAASPTSTSSSQLPSLNSPFDGYRGHRGTHAGTHTADRALDPGMAVRNGSVYDAHGRPRLLQPQPRRSPSYDLLKGSFEASGKHSAKVLKLGGYGRKPDGKR